MQKVPTFAQLKRVNQNNLILPSNKAQLNSGFVIERSGRQRAICGEMVGVKPQQ